MIHECDLCSSTDQVEQRRLGNKQHLFTAELCAKCRQLPVDVVLEKIQAARAPRATLKATSLDQIDRDRSQYRRIAKRGSRRA